MRQLVGALPIPDNSNGRILAGFENAEDAAVYKLDANRALAISIDVITPLVDDAEIFGRIAAANALSDLYAMGATGLMSLSFLGVPKNFDINLTTAIARGGALTALEAGAPVLGGHTVESQDLLFGLAVIGEVHPDKLIRNHGLTAGDKLLLTKPLGTGTLTTALKQEKRSALDIEEAVLGMLLLNRAATPLLQSYRAHISAVTDISGFGLLGHAAEMANGSEVSIRIHAAHVPAYQGARQAISKEGIITRGNGPNLRYAQSLLQVVHHSGSIKNIDPILLDPQTSGGLLIGVHAQSADELCTDLIAAGYTRTCIVGEVSSGDGLEIY